MPSIILNVTARFLLPCLLLLSLIVLYRGHYLPGGGFIGGLIASCGFILYVLGPGVDAARRALRVSPETLIGLGLLIALVSALWSAALGQTFMTGLWLPGFYVPILGKVLLGTPFLFDVGVYLVVVGFTLLTIFTLSDCEK